MIFSAEDVGSYGHCDIISVHLIKVSVCSHLSEEIYAKFQSIEMDCLLQFKLN